jgi:hypothetical protein
MEDRRAGDVYKWHLGNGLSSEESGPTEKRGKSNVPLVSNLGECTSAYDRSEHLGASVLLFEDTGFGDGA